MAKKIIKVEELPKLILASGLGGIFGLAFGVIFIVLGIVMFNLPFIGGIVGLFLIVGGILMPIAGFRAIKLDK